MAMRIIDRVIATAARRRLSPATVSCYTAWIRGFLRFLPPARRDLAATSRAWNKRC